MNQVLVLGGSGFVGRHVCEQLARAGVRITLPTRRASNARAVQHLPGLDVIEADIHDEAALARLLPGHDAVVNLVGVLHGSEARFQAAHVELPRRLARAMQQAGVRRLVHISALGASADGPSRYQRSKAEGEAVLREAGLELTLLRPSVIFGADDRFIRLFARLQALAPVMALAGANARFQPVWVEDVAAALVRCLLDPATAGRVIECAGPDIWTLSQLVRLAGRWSGHERPILPLPDWAGRLQAAALGLLPGEPLMSGDNLDSMKVPNVATGRHPGLETLGLQPASLGAVMAPLLQPGPTAADLRRAWRR